MKLLSAAQIRQWDQYTIEHEPIASVALMERAAKASAKWILQNTLADVYYIFCAKGNNGGDGLAIARLLHHAGKEVKAYILESESQGTDDFNSNFNRLRQLEKVPIMLIRSANYPVLPANAIIIDALFGTGLNRALNGDAKSLVHFLNDTGNIIISIDMPSGMLCDQSSAGFPIIKAKHTLTFQCLKMAFLIPENEPYFGDVHILDINLLPEFTETIETRFQLVNKPVCQLVYKKRKDFAHKGNFGHALLIAGSYGKMGAAVLSSIACLRSGVGLLTCQVPKKGVEILQCTILEAMVHEDDNENFIANTLTNTADYSAIGIGPGLGTHQQTQQAFYKYINDTDKPLVIDADALNILSLHPEWLSLLRKNTLLTPHPKEFSKLFGEKINDYTNIEIAIQKAAELQVIIILKGHHTFIATPSGKGYFNITGNAGMATAGSGDVLTGILTGLLAQGYLPEEAAILGVFLHGLAGDLAIDIQSMESLIASDIVDMLGKAFHAIND